jgi:hypothetical protein
VLLQTEWSLVRPSSLVDDGSWSTIALGDNAGGQQVEVGKVLDGTVWQH